MRKMPYGRSLVLCAALVGCACGATSASDESKDGIFHWAISTTVEIDAAPAKVWSTLVDLPAYEEWNPFIVEASGDVAVGETLSMRMVLPGRDPMTIKPSVLVVDPGREFRWKGRLLIPGLFDGEHVFELQPIADGRTRVHHWERFGGLLLPIAKGLIYDDTVAAFHALNDALAKRAEARAEPH